LSTGRPYLPATARFLTALAGLDRSSASSYSYVNTNAPALVDPDGEDEDIVTGIPGAPPRGLPIIILPALVKIISKIRIVGLIRSHLARLEQLPAAKCFGITPFKTTLVDWLNQQSAWHFSVLPGARFVDYIRGVPAVYWPTNEILYVWDLGDPVNALHEALHFYDDAHKIFNKSGAPYWLDTFEAESFAYAAEALLTHFEAVSRSTDDLGKHPEDIFSSCGGVQARWYLLVEQFKPITERRWALWPFARISLPRLGFSHEKVGWIMPRFFYEVSKLGLRFDCRCLLGIWKEAALAAFKDCCLEDCQGAYYLFL
jgi:hypothetical protein